MSRLRFVPFLILAAEAVANPAFAEYRAPPNVRAFFESGYSAPVQFFDRVQDGFGFGGGLELEANRIVSALFRFDYDVLRGENVFEDYEYRSYSSFRDVDFSSMSWTIAGRAYFNRHAPRFYSELGYGIRFQTDRNESYGYLSPLARDGNDVEGMVVSLRLGVSAARFHGGGLFVESGYQGLVRNPEVFAIVPARLGIVFP